MFRYILLTFVVGLLSCQSQAAALKFVCDAPDQPDVQNLSPEMKATRMAEYIEANVSNRDIQQAMKALENTDPATRVKMIKPLLDEAGISKCSIRDLWATPRPEKK